MWGGRIRPVPAVATAACIVDRSYDLSVSHVKLMRLYILHRVDVPVLRKGVNDDLRSLDAPLIVV